MSQQTLKAWRTSVGLSQTQLAHAIGGHPGQISTYENGHVTPSLDTVLAIVRTLRMAGAVLTVEDISFASSTADRNSDNAA